MLAVLHLHVYSICAVFVVAALHCYWCLNACCTAVLTVLAVLDVLDVHLHVHLISAVFLLPALHCCWCLNACCTVVLTVIAVL